MLSGMRAQLAERIPARGSAPRRAALTMTDQCFSSASNFAVGIVVGRIAGPSGLGAYAVAYAIWLILAAAHRALITDPMSIDNDARGPHARAKLQAGWAAELMLGAAAGGVVALASVLVLLSGQRGIGFALLALAPLLPFLLAQDYWRWAGFMQARPGLSLLNDAVFNVVQAGALAFVVLIGAHSPSLAILAWGTGAVAGSLYGLRQFSVKMRSRGGYAHVASRWCISKWLLASGFSSWANTQAYTLVAGPFVGAAGLGGLKAAQSLVAGPSQVLAQAAGSIGLPEAAHGLERGGWEQLRRIARWITIMTVTSVGIVAAVVFFFGAKLLGWLYGPAFTQYETTARIVAIGWLVPTFSGGAILILKVTRNTRTLFQIGIVTTVVLIGSTIVLASRWGVNGAATADVIATSLNVCLQLRARRRVARDLAAATSAPDVAHDVEHDARPEPIELDR